jgi:hypothetical protein
MLIQNKKNVKFDLGITKKGLILTLKQFLWYKITAMSQKFQKKVEDFICEHCGEQVFGDGYTNHCPRCLWSKHVDINPGDRAATCGGLMVPEETVLEHGVQHLVHRCRRCGYIKKNKVSPQDNFEALLTLMKRAPRL